MKSINSVLLFALSSAVAFGHAGHDHDTDGKSHGKLYVESDWGGLFFRHASEYQLPSDDGLQKYLIRNHGGSVDDPSTSDLLTTIGAKVIRFETSPGMGTILEDKEQFGVGNFHGLDLTESGDASLTLVFADNQRHLVRRRSYGSGEVTDYKPDGGVHDYFANGGSFNPTDVEQHPVTGDVWVFDGYGSSLVFATEGDKSVFGGKETFNTSHGGAHYNGNWVVASRGSGEICTVDSDGKVTERFLISEGDRPCDIDFIGDYALIGCLSGPGTKETGYPGAPCYIYHWPSKQRLATIVPKADFNLERGTHIHNAAWWPHVVDGRVQRLFIAFSFWNPGDFHVVEVSGLPLEWLKPESID